MNFSLADIREIISVIDDLYPVPNTHDTKKITDLDKALMFASKNRFLYYFITRALKKGVLQETPQLDNLKKKGEEGIAKFHRTLDFLNSKFGRESFLVLKTYKGYPYVTWDVDILIQDVKKVASNLASDGFRITGGKEAGKLSCHSENLLVLGLHERISWHSLKVMDDKLPWNNPRFVKFEGIQTVIPSLEADFLTFIAHTNFENYHLILGELLYIYKLATEVNWDIIQEQVVKHRWQESFQKTLSIANGLHRILYSKPSPMEMVVPSISKVQLRFPFMYPHHYIVSFSREIQGIRLRSLSWELFFYTYRLYRIWRVKKPAYLDSFLYGHLLG